MSFEPVSHVCKLGAVAHVLAGTTHFLITCTSVSDFSFRSTIPEQWTYADVTEVYLTPDAVSYTHLDVYKRQILLGITLSVLLALLADILLVLVQRRLTPWARPGAA